MATTTRGLIYPDSSAHTRIWEHLQNLAASADTAIGNATTTRAGGIVLPSRAYSAVSFVQINGTATDDANFPSVGGFTRSGASLVCPAVAGYYSITAQVAYATGSAAAAPTRKGVGVSSTGSTTSPDSDMQDTVPAANAAGGTYVRTFTKYLPANAVLTLFSYTDTVNAYANASGWIRAVQVSRG